MKIISKSITRTVCQFRSPKYMKPTVQEVLTDRINQAVDELRTFLQDHAYLPILPPDVEVFRASGDCICQVCNLTYYDHPRYAYESGLGECVRACDGRYLHL